MSASIAATVEQVRRPRPSDAQEQRCPLGCSSCDGGGGGGPSQASRGDGGSSGRQSCESSLQWLQSLVPVEPRGRGCLCINEAAATRTPLVAAPPSRARAPAWKGSPGGGGVSRCSWLGSAICSCSRLLLLTLAIRLSPPLVLAEPTCVPEAGQHLRWQEAHRRCEEGHRA